MLTSTISMIFRMPPIAPFRPGTGTPSNDSFATSNVFRTVFREVLRMSSWTGVNAEVFDDPGMGRRTEAGAGADDASGVGTRVTGANTEGGVPG